MMVVEINNNVGDENDVAEGDKYDDLGMLIYSRMDQNKDKSDDNGDDNYDNDYEKFDDVVFRNLLQFIFIRI